MPKRSRSRIEIAQPDSCVVCGHRGETREDGDVYCFRHWPRLKRLEYEPCAECARKVGAYKLCNACVINRTLIDRLRHSKTGDLLAQLLSKFFYSGESRDGKCLFFAYMDHTPIAEIDKELDRELQE